MLHFGMTKLEKISDRNPCRQPIRPCQTCCIDSQARCSQQHLQSSKRVAGTTRRIRRNGGGSGRPPSARNREGSLTLLRSCAKRYVIPIHWHARYHDWLHWVIGQQLKEFLRCSIAFADSNCTGITESFVAEVVCSPSMFAAQACIWLILDKQG